jgi:hypothetical protein
MKTIDNANRRNKKTEMFHCPVLPFALIYLLLHRFLNLFVNKP